uniref:receptor-type tyrosine-protein phosphatase R isoform X3 n=1 Tax=Podarcis muralis TaxID=64176 RepID=UPI0010A0731E|nr:receptor-type tyrosine-protein phosphatase R isoform X3 [Podarcis muralis]
MWTTAACLPVACLLLQLQAAGCFSGDNDHFLAIHQRMSRKPIFIYHHVQSVEKSLDTSDQKDYGHNSHLSSHGKISKLHPAVIVKPAYEPSLNLLAMTGDEDQEVENLPIPAANVITVVLYRLKEKIQFSVRQDKNKKQEIHLSSIPLQRTPPEYKAANRMVQPEPAPKAVNVIVDPQGQCAPEIKPTLSTSPSPFKIKSVGLQERRGSNVSLTLDMSSLGSIEPFVAVPTPREKVAMEYLQSASRILTRQQLQDTVTSSHLLQTEFMEIPMNFVDPKEIDIPSHGTKNRYKTILPNPVSRVCLKPKNPSDALSTYINANYIRGYGGQEKAFIATQGPMINTVNDFWLMVWQEDSPVIVMITKLKEKNEKCVLYWPEKRGIYGKVEVLVNSVQECENYTVRNLTLKQGNLSRHVKHYWYTSWPDHKTPDSAQPLLQLMLDVEEDRVGSVGRGPVIVHCSAGIGRTGCFIATAIGCHQLKEEGVVDALSIVCQLRLDRGGMVQTSEQYEFVHHALNLYESRPSAEAVQ